jgi:spermidine/putrescine transport system substrate-binding protein
MTGKTALLNRRTLLKTGAAAGATAIAAPWVMKGALAASGELNFLGWSGYDAFPEVFKTFEGKTGIKVNFTGLGSQDEMLAQAKTGAATNGAFDICEPTIDRLSNWTDNGFVQPWDEKKANVGGLEGAFAEGSGSRMTIPSVWGSESITYNTKEAPLAYGKASLMDLFDDKYAGKLTLRGHSGLMAAGRALDAQGKLPHKYNDSFKDKDKMVANYDAILKFALSKRKNIAQFWSNENEAQGAFRTNGCVIGMCWDTSAAALMAEGLPISYLSPVEGATGWLQNFVLLKGAKNTEQAHAWVSWINTPEGGAAWAKAFGANSTAKGAVNLASDQQKKFFAAAYPADALSKIWWWPEQPGWFVEKRTDYAKKFTSA